jgi:uncharacterized protein YoxC
MNERITQLVEQARKYASEYVEDEVEMQFHKKFAKLIVQEMCQVMKAEGEQFSLDQNFDAVKGVGRCMRKVKQHFGVEE